MHGLFFGVFLEKGADQMRINLLDGDNEVGGEKFGGIDEKEWSITQLVLDPKGDNVVEAVQDAIDANATLGNFDMCNIWRCACKETQSNRGNDDEKAKKYIDKTDDDKIKYFYLIDSDFEGLLKHTLPSFWTTQLSKNKL